MNIVLNPADLEPPIADWRNSKSYLWIRTLPRRAIAWEFLRRNPRYCETYAAQQGKVGAVRDWPMVRLRRSAIECTPGGACLDQDGL